MTLEHVAINVQEPAQMAQWLVQHLGMRIIVANDTPPFIHFVADDKGSMLEIYHNTSAQLPDYPNMSAFNLHLAFSSSHIEADRDRLIAAGATLVSDINTTPAGDKLVFLRDPWGVPFQFVQRAKPLI